MSRALLTAAALLATAAVAEADPLTTTIESIIVHDPNVCGIDGVRLYQNPVWGLAIEGSTTCGCGEVSIRVFTKDKKFLGNAHGVFGSEKIKGNAFTLYVTDLKLDQPASLDLKADIDVNGCPAERAPNQQE